LTQVKWEEKLDKTIDPAISEVVTRERLLNYGVKMLHEGNAGGNVEVHIKMELLHLPCASGQIRWLHDHLYSNMTFTGAIYTNFQTAVLFVLLVMVFWEPYVDGLITEIQYVGIHGGLMSIYGFDVMLVAVISYCASRPVEGTSLKHYEIFGEARLPNNVFIAPILWLVGMGDLLFRSPERESQTDMLGHFVVPLLLVERSEFLWNSVKGFFVALKASYGVISLLVCTIVLSASLSPVLLRNAYNAGDFYEDNQHQNFIISCSSMFTFMVTGNNYIESLEQPLLDPMWWFFFIYFLIILVLGLFFIAAILIETLQGAFLEGGDQSMERRQRQLASAIMYVIWQRHSNGTPQPMTFDVFMESIMQQGRLWPKIQTESHLVWLQEHTHTHTHTHTHIRTRTHT